MFEQVKNEKEARIKGGGCGGSGGESFKEVTKDLFGLCRMKEHSKMIIYDRQSMWIAPFYQAFEWWK